MHNLATENLPLSALSENEITEFSDRSKLWPLWHKQSTPPSLCYNAML